MKQLFYRLLRRFTKTKLYNYIPDKLAVSIKYHYNFGKRLDLKNPQTFNEKLQWLKLYDRRPEYTMMVDKYRAKEYVASIIGEEYIIPTLGVWKSFDEIDFDALPDQFVLKCNHGSGDAVICKDKASFNIESARQKLTDALKEDYYLLSREWPYKNVERRIIAEQYIEDAVTCDARDYKIYCFNGLAKYVMLCLDRQIGKTKYYFFDHKWELQRINKHSKEAPEEFTVSKPQCLDEMYSVSSELSKGFAFLRVDLYECNGRIYFGELTFYPFAGLDTKLLEKWDLTMGSWLTLPEPRIK